MEPDTDPTADEIAAEPLLQLFRRQVAKLPRNPERSMALRKLREAKDCAVTALLWIETRPAPTKVPGPGVGPRHE